MKKSLLGVLLTLMLALFLTACGGTDTQEANQVEGDATTEVQSSESSGDPSVVDSITITMGGASPNGFWSLLGNGIGSIISDNIANTQYSYETGNGVKNMISVANGEIEAGMAFNFEVKAGLEGDEPFPEAVENVQALATLYNNSPVQIIISKDFADKYGITSMEDIAEKQPPINVGVNQKGNLSEKVNRVIFEAYGITYEDIESWGGKVFYETYKPAADMMKDNQIDWIGVPVFAPDGKFMELASSKNLMILSINEKAQQLLKEKMDLPAGTIKAGTYDFQDGDIATSDAGAILLASPNMTVDEAYTITKILVENIEQYKSLHQNLSSLTPEMMADTSPAELHPGAKKYYEEAGLLN